MFYASHVITTKQKPTEHTQEIKIIEAKDITLQKIIDSQRKQKKEEKKQGNYETAYKQ